jgi:hypothetical protein
MLFVKNPGLEDQVFQDKINQHYFLKAKFIFSYNSFESISCHLELQQRAYSPQLIGA